MFEKYNYNNPNQCYIYAYWDNGYTQPSFYQTNEEWTFIYKNAGNCYVLLIY